MKPNLQQQRFMEALGFVHDNNLDSFDYEPWSFEGGPTVLLGADEVPTAKEVIAHVISLAREEGRVKARKELGV